MYFLVSESLKDAIRASRLACCVVSSSSVLLSAVVRAAKTPVLLSAKFSVALLMREIRPSLPVMIPARLDPLLATALFHFLSSNSSNPVFCAVLMPNSDSVLLTPDPEGATSSLRIDDTRLRTEASPVSPPPEVLPSTATETLVVALIAVINVL
ncbi:hypothetical protein D3C84_948650 [compost metagenome]